MNLLARFHSMSIVWSLSAQGEWKWDLVKGDRSGRYALRFTSIDFQNCLMVDGEAYGYAIAKSMYGFEPFQIQHRIELVSSPEELVPERETSSTKDITECSNGSILRRAPTSRHLNWPLGMGRSMLQLRWRGSIQRARKYKESKIAIADASCPTIPAKSRTIKTPKTVRRIFVWVYEVSLQARVIPTPSRRAETKSK